MCHTSVRLLSHNIYISSQNNRIVAMLVDAINIQRVIVVPSIGNWDTYPVSQLAPSSNVRQSEMLEVIWKSWSPLFASGILRDDDSTIRSSFLSGGFYARTLIPQQLTALSINTLTFFVENYEVGDCSPLSTRHGPSEFGRERRNAEDFNHGDEQLNWMETELIRARADGRWVIILGQLSCHVTKNVKG